VTSDIPAEFGGTPQAFAEEWCRGAPLGYSGEEIGQALSTIKRLWPSEVSRVTTGTARGVGVVAPVIERGLLLAKCETAHSFLDVLRRLKQGERPAYSELILGAALRQLAYDFEFQPPIGGSVLDAKCSIDGMAVFFEVVTPDQSDAAIDRAAIVQKLHDNIKQKVSNCRVEVELSASFREHHIPMLVRGIEVASGGKWTNINSHARIRRIDEGEKLLRMFDGAGAQVVVADETDIQGTSTNVMVYWEESDERFQRVFRQKYRQLSEGVANVLVVDTCAVGHALNTWPARIASLLRPAQNRKVGAVIFFYQGILPNPVAIRRRWRVLSNSHATVKIPDALLTGIESLDQSGFYGAPRPERIIAA
jgi:hypothetical protein